MPLRFNLNALIVSKLTTVVKGNPGVLPPVIEGSMTTLGLESRYEGPIREATVRVAGRSIVLVRPGEPDRLLDDPEVAAWSAAVDYMPYWAYLWPGAFLLAEAVAVEPCPAGAPALEIGCGLGLAGLVAVARGLTVRFTDYDRAPLRFVERSARANGFDPSSYSTAVLDWRDPPADRYSLIFGSDVTYEARLIPPVARAIAGLLADDGLALISDPNRSSADGFAAALAAHGLATEATPAEGESDELGRVRGRIFRIWRPGAGSG